MLHTMQKASNMGSVQEKSNTHQAVPIFSLGEKSQFLGFELENWQPNKMQGLNSNLDEFLNIRLAHRIK